MAFKPPMLARTYGDEDGRGKTLVQPKLDGVRMLTLLLPDGRVRLFSRTGHSFDHLIPVIFPRASKMGEPGTLLDGELYVHGEGFQAIVSAVKDRGLAGPLVPRLAYHLYDAILPGAAGKAAPYAARRKAIADAAAAAGGGHRLEVVPTAEADGRADVERLMRKWNKAGGYEGVMVRDPDAPYEPGKRSRSLLKYKRFDDAEFEIVGHEEATGKDRGTVVFVCSNGRGKGSKGAEGTKGPDATFRVRPTGTRAERAKMLRDVDSLVGKMLTVRFQGRTDGGLPRFPVGVAVRDYENLFSSRGGTGGCGP